MICYKFKYKGEDAPAQTITTACGSSIYIAIPKSEGETIVLSDGVDTYSASGIIPGYYCYKVVTSGTQNTTNFTATITGTVDETSYTHTISIKVISNAVSYGEITSV